MHPGYGFLSEREAFAQALAEGGIVFIGPNPRAIAAMGDKIEVEEGGGGGAGLDRAGLSGVIESAGARGDDRRRDRLSGDDQGVRRRRRQGHAHRLFARTRWRTASRARSRKRRPRFGDDRVFVEKFIADPRHIEIQVLGDKHGNVIYLGERECSIQRRNQKVIEEAPSPLLDEATRRKMGEQAVALAKAVDYDSAGTVEFVAGQDRSFYFLEMNTRLQVEHPVTEMITGIDLVEADDPRRRWRAAALKQADVSSTAGRSRAASMPRIRRATSCPPRAGLSPTGRRRRAARTASRCATTPASIEGGEISIYYDPMIAKLVTHAPTRAEAIEAQARRARRLRHRGHPPQHPVPVGADAASALARGAPLHRLHRRGISGGLHAAGAAGRSRAAHGGGRGRHRPPCSTSASAASRARCATQAPCASSATASCCWRRAPRHRGEDDRRRRCRASSSDGQRHTGRAAWRPGRAGLARHGRRRAVAVQVRPILNGFALAHAGAAPRRASTPGARPELAALMPREGARDTGKQLLCPMPGLVKSICSCRGQEVKAGEPLAMVEAMKMENVLRAERDATVAKIHAKEGDSLAVDAVILEFAGSPLPYGDEHAAAGGEMQMPALPARVAHKGQRRDFDDRTGRP